MNKPLIISGKEVSDLVYDSLKLRIISLDKQNITPGLAVIIIGEDPASQLYVQSKTRIFNKLGLYTHTYELPTETTENELIKIINNINEDNSFNGILVQLPLPVHINSNVILNAISPKKDVDGFHPENAGLLAIGRPRFIPCTPKGIMRMFTHYSLDLNTKHIVVIGRSNIVGRPISILTSLKSENANGTTTLCHSGTKNIEYYTQQADIIIIALGSPGFLTGKMIKEGSVIIDVGINRVIDDSEKGYKVLGDVDWDSVLKKVSAITPVPGGVGQMTIAMLVENTIEAAENKISSQMKRFKT